MPSIIVFVFVHHEELEEYLDERSIFFLILFYQGFLLSCSGETGSALYNITGLLFGSVSGGCHMLWHTKKNFGVESGLNYLLFIGCFAIVYFITGKYRKHLEKKYENEFSQDDKSDKE